MPEINSEDKVAKNYQEVEGITNADRTTVDAYVRDSGKNAEGTLTTLMKKSAEELKEKRIEAYKKDKGMQNLDDVAQREAEAYELPESELREACNATAKEMYDVYFERNRVLNKIMGNKSEIEAAQKAGQTPEYGKIKNHLDLLEKEDTERQNKINEIQDKIKKLQEEGKEELPEGAKEGEEPKFVKQAEIDALQTEIDGLQEERKRIAEIKESTKALEERCRIAFKAQAEARENIENNLRETYGEKIADEAIKTHGSKQREQEYNELQNEAENKKKEDKNKEDKTQNDNLDQQNLDDLEKAGIAAGAAQQVAKGAVGGPVVGGAEVVGDAVEPEEKQVEDLDNFFGLENISSLEDNYAGSWEVLDKFSSSDISDATRLALLNNPNARETLLKAFNEVDTFHPIQGRKYLESRLKILNLAKGPMMETALKSMGIPINDINEVGKQFEKINNEYKSKRAEIENNQSLEDEEKEKLLADIDEHYKSIKNVDTFQFNAKKVRSARTMMLDAKNWLSKTLNKEIKFNKNKTLDAAKEENVIEASDAAVAQETINQDNIEHIAPVESELTVDTKTKEPEQLSFNFGEPTDTLRNNKNVKKIENRSNEELQEVVNGKKDTLAKNTKSRDGKDAR